MSVDDEKVAGNGDPVDASDVALDTEKDDVKLTHAKFAKNKHGDEEPAVVIATPLGKKDQKKSSPSKDDASASQARQLLGEMNEDDPASRTYGRRWLVLAVVALLNNSNTMSWIAFAPIANFVDEFYDLTDAANWFSLIYMICTIPVGIFAMWAGGKFGLRSAILIAGWTNGVGALIRLTSSFLPLALRFPVGIFGQAIAAVAYPFIMFLPTKVAAAWFPDNQRALATTIGVMSNPLGVLLANVIAPVLVTATEHVPYLNVLTAVPAVATCILATVCVRRSEPPVPPTQSAATREMPFFEGMKDCFTNRAYLLLLLVMGGGIGMFNCLYTVMQQLLCPSGYTNFFSGLCAALMIVGGVFGAAGAGVFVDRTKLYEETMKVAMACAVVVGLLFMQLTLHPGLSVPIAIACFVFGFLGLAMYPVGLEMSAECTFPVATTTATGLIVISGQIQSVIYVAVMKSLARPLRGSRREVQVCSLINETTAVTARDMSVALMVFSAIATALVLVLIIFFKPVYKRLNAETAGKAPPPGAKAKASALDARQLLETNKEVSLKPTTAGDEMQSLTTPAVALPSSDGDDASSAANDSRLPLITGEPHTAKA